MRLPVALSFACAIAAVGCAPNPTPPVNVMALLYGSANKLGPKQTTLTTIENTVALKGSTVNLVGGAGITIDPTDPLQQNAQTDDEVINALFTSRGTDVHANLIDKGGVLWPGDFHSWAMVTTYWNFEQAFLYFQKAYGGESTKKLAGAQVLYWASYLNLNASDQPQTDNMFYDPAVKVFVVVPFQVLQKVPLSMNIGIVGHEFAHRVWAQKTYADRSRVPQVEQWQGAPVNILRALDEGFADFHGYGVTCTAKDGPGCSTRFLAPSFADGEPLHEETVAKRDVARTDACMTKEIRVAIDLDNFSFMSQGHVYDLGTLFAAALFRASNNAGKIDVMQAALIKSYDDPSASTPGFRQVLEANLSTSERFTLEEAAGVIINHVTDPDLQRLVCNELWDRLDLTAPIPHCPNTSVRNNNTCPPVM